MGDLSVVYSVSKPFERWIQANIPKIPHHQPLNIKPLQTEPRQVCWQFHVIHHTPSTPFYTVIAVEAHSWYTLIFPFTSRPSISEFEESFVALWIQESTHLLIENGLLSNDDIESIHEVFLENFSIGHWQRSVDLKLQGHIVSVEKWIRSTLARLDTQKLDTLTAIDLSRFINGQMKKVEVNDHQESFVPSSRFTQHSLNAFFIPAAKRRQTQECRIKYYSEPIDNVVFFDAYKKYFGD